LKKMPIIGNTIKELEKEIEDKTEILKYTDMDDRIRSKGNLYIRYEEILRGLKEGLNCEVEIKRIKEDKKGKWKITEIKNSHKEKRDRCFLQTDPHSLASLAVSNKKAYHLTQDSLLAKVYSIDTSKGKVEKERLEPVQKEAEIMKYYNEYYNGEKEYELFVTPFFHEDELMGTISLKRDKIENKQIQLLETRKEFIGESISDGEIFEEMRWKSTHDGLTGLYNRRFLDQKLDEELDTAMKLWYGYRVSVLMIDIDNFKKNINDKYGHQAGDGVLKETAKRLESLCEREGGTVARYGGEEYAVIFPGRGHKDYESQKGAVTLAEELRKYIEEDFYKGIDEKVTISIGVADTELTINHTKIKFDNPEDIKSIIDHMKIKYHPEDLKSIIDHIKTKFDNHEFAEFNKAYEEYIKSLKSKDIDKKIKIYHNFYSKIPILGRAIINCADNALYDAKNSGRNIVKLFDPQKDMETKITEIISYESKNQKTSSNLPKILDKVE